MALNFPLNIFSAEDDVLYTISGYNKSNIITDSNGEKIKGYAYCLDNKAGTPSSSDGAVYHRIKLSELEQYSKIYDQHKVYDDDMKTRLVKIIVASSEIKKWVRNNLKEYPDKTWFPDNAKSLDLSWEKAAWGRLSDEEYREAVSTALDTRWKEFTNSAIQHLVWLLTHDESEWDEFVHDDGTSSGHADDYYFQSNLRLYVSADPMNDEHSLWNIFYEPVLDYIDNDIPDYYAMGYDVWVYVTDNENKQNMLGAAFFEEKNEITISKKGSDGNGELKGALLILRGKDGDEKTIVFESKNVEFGEGSEIVSGSGAGGSSEGDSTYESGVSSTDTDTYESGSTSTDTDTFESGSVPSDVPKKITTYSKTDTSDGGKLPKTGGLVNTWSMSAFGAILSLIGVYIFGKKKDARTSKNCK